MAIFSRNLLAFVLGAATFGAARLRADNVVLKNGDTLSGTITQIDPTSVKLTSPVLGALTVPREQVKTMRSDAQVTVIDAQGAVHNANIGPTDNAAAWTEVPATLPATVMTPIPPGAPKAAVAAPPIDLERYYLPLGPHWKNQLLIGLLNTTGNSESTQFTGEVDFAYKVAPSELTMKFGGAYGHTDDSRSAELAFADIVYRRDLPEWHSDRWFMFGENHELYDGLKGVSFRTNDDGGLGYYLLKGKKLNVDVRGGPGYTYERHFDGSENSDFVGIAGLRALYAMSDRVSMGEDALYTNGLTNIERYQITSETSMNIKLPELARGLGLKFSFVDSYDSTAVKPAKQNDTRLVVGVTVDF